MASGDNSKNAKADWKTRDAMPRGSPTMPNAPQPVHDVSQGHNASLRSRISEQEPRSLPQGPSGFRNEATSDRRAEGLNIVKEERESSRKRASSGKVITFLCFVSVLTFPFRT